MSPLLTRTPERRPPPDSVMLERRPAARACASLDPMGVQLAHPGVSLPDAEADHGTGRASQLVQLIVGELACRRPRRDSGPPQDLVRHQVADPGDHVLVHDPGLDRRLTPPDPLPELVAADLGGVRSETGEVRVEDRPSQPSHVPKGQAAAVLELEREAVPATGVWILVHADPAGHAQVQTEHRSRIGLDPHRLPVPVGGRQTRARQGLRDLAWAMGPGNPGVRVLDGRDAPAQSALLDDPPGNLHVGELGHRGLVALELGAAVVEFEDPHRSGGRGVEAEPAEDALVQVLADDLHASVTGRVDVDGAGLLELLRKRCVTAHRVVDLDADEGAVAPHAATPMRSLTRSGISAISSATTIPAEARRSIFSVAVSSLPSTIVPA